MYYCLKETFTIVFCESEGEGVLLFVGEIHCGVL